MTNILVRTSAAALTALTISTTALALSAAPVAAAQNQSQLQNHVQLVGGKHHGKRAKHGHRARHGHQRLYPQQIVRILERRGYRNVRRVYFSHGKYFARARGHHGPVKLVVHARNGRILSRQRIARPHRDFHRGFYGRPHNGFSWSFTFGR